MKRTGIILLIIGFIMTLYAVLIYVRRENVTDLRKLEITKENRRAVNWQPYVGIGMMVIGGAFLILGRKKSQNI